MFCAGYLDGGVDACFGDSGGPAIYVQSDESGEQIRARLLGMISWGKGCAEAGWPGVYARTSGVYDWVLSTAETMLRSNVFTTTSTTTTTTTTPLGPMPLSKLGLDSYDCESNFDEDRSGLWRIVGGFGSDNIMETWPWMANLNAMCGGAIIGSQYILTAAHCCVDGALDNASIFVGSID